MLVSTLLPLATHQQAHGSGCLSNAPLTYSTSMPSPFLLECRVEYHRSINDNTIVHFSTYSIPSLTVSSSPFSLNSNRSLVIQEEASLESTPALIWSGHLQCPPSGTSKERVSNHHAPSISYILSFALHNAYNYNAR